MNGIDDRKTEEGRRLGEWVTWYRQNNAALSLARVSCSRLERHIGALNKGARSGQEEAAQRALRGVADCLGPAQDAVAKLDVGAWLLDSYIPPRRFRSRGYEVRGKPARPDEDLYYVEAWVYQNERHLENIAESIRRWRGTLDDLQFVSALRVVRRAGGFAAATEDLRHDLGAIDPRGWIPPGADPGDVL